MQYALFANIESNEKIKIQEEYTPKLENLAELGDPFSMYMMGISVLNDEYGLESDAVEWLVKAAMGGFYRAYYGLALRYQNGQGVGKDIESAEIWRSLAADTFPNYYKPAYDPTGIFQEHTQEFCKRNYEIIKELETL